MLFLYSTPDSSFAELAKSTLREDGIEVFDPEDDPTVSSLESNAWPYTRHQHRIYLACDEDFDRAQKRLIEIGADDSKPTLPSARMAIWGFYISLSK
jgi:hypothetical protein